jgi:hypothetical protein
MVQLDLNLLFKARRLITGANVHRLKTMIFVYEEAVTLHNQGHPRHLSYQNQHELELRAYVGSCCAARSPATTWWHM